MANGSEFYVKAIKTIVRECWDTERKVVLQRPKLEYVSSEIDRSRQSLFVRITKYLMETNKFREETKIYVSNYYVTYKGVHGEMLHLGESLPVNTVVTHIRRDVVRMKKMFPSQMLSDLLLGDGGSVSFYERILDELEREVVGKSGCSIEGEMFIEQLHIPLGFDDSCNVSDSDLLHFLNQIKPYTRAVVESIEDKLDRNVCGYVRRLLINGGSNEIEYEHLRKIQSAISRFSGNKKVV